MTTINFLSDTVIAIEKDSTIYVPMKRICDNLRIAWNSQLIKIKDDPVLSCSMMEIIMETNASPRETVCLPLKYI